MSELSARYLLSQGAQSVCVINRTYEHAVELATTLGGSAAAFDERWQKMKEADVVISSTSCPHTILSRDEASMVVRDRGARPWLWSTSRCQETLTAQFVKFPESSFTTSTTWKELCNITQASGKPPRWKPKRSWNRKRADSAASCWPSVWCDIVALRSRLDDFAGKNWSPSKKSAGRSPKMKLFY